MAWLVFERRNPVRAHSERKETTEVETATVERDAPISRLGRSCIVVGRLKAPLGLRSTQGDASVAVCEPGSERLSYDE